MNPGQRTGFDDRVGVARAKPARVDGPLDDDPSPMVQEQIARLRYFGARHDMMGRSVLELGSGAGFNCQYVSERFGAARTLGIDISAPSVDFAKRTYPAQSYGVGDICDPSLDLGRRQWDYVMCCEVIEHVPEPEILLANVEEHLADGGVAFITTPNIEVFSLGHVPSPVNQTHLKEYSLAEFSELLRSRFSEVSIAGQYFSSDRLFEAHQSIVRRNVRDFRLLGDLYWQPLVRRAWKLARLEPLIRMLFGDLKYTHADFTVEEPVSARSAWFCAIVSR